MVGKLEFIAEENGTNSINVDMKDVSMNDKANILRGIMEGIRITPMEALLLIMAIKEHADKKGDDEE